MGERDRIIRSLGELIDLVTPADPDATTGRLRDVGVYRGSGAADRPLLTSLDRLGGYDPPHTKAHLEEHILRNFGRYARPHLSTPPANDWELLVVAQHHGVPTRLLDWSSSPLVAAHFATTTGETNTDRAIWRLEWPRLHEAFGFPGLALLIDDLIDLWKDEQEEFTPWKLFAGQAPDFACMIEPPWLDDRIVAQSGTFTLCSDTTKPFDVFLSEQGLSDALTRYVIPANCVQHLRDQLDLVGMDERRLFPHLGGLADSLRRYYG